jgi:hypothetical protein
MNRMRYELTMGQERGNWAYVGNTTPIIMEEKGFTKPKSLFLLLLYKFLLSTFYQETFPSTFCGNWTLNLT